jgi:hypothetical protein
MFFFVVNHQPISEQYFCTDPDIDVAAFMPTIFAATHKNNSEVFWRYLFVSIKYVFSMRGLKFSWKSKG